MEKQAQLKNTLNALAGHIRSYRKALGFTQEQLAEKSGLSPNYIARLEISANTPSLPALVSLAKALDVQVSDLLAIKSDYTWLNEAEEIAWMLNDLDRSDIEYILSQLQHSISFMKSKQKG